MSLTTGPVDFLQIYASYTFIDLYLDISIFKNVLVQKLLGIQHNY